MREAIIIIMGAVLANNFVLVKFLGICPFLGVSKKLDSASSDGSEKFYAILAEDVDATLADSVGAVYLTGEFNQSALVLGGTTTAASVKAAARYAGVFFRAAKA